MTKADDRIDDVKFALGAIDKRVKDLEDKVGKTREEALASNLEQYKMITKAVAEGNKPIMEKIDEIDKRIIVLENAEANKALEDKRQFWRTARTTVLGVVITFFATVLLNNLIIIASSNNNNNNTQNDNKIEKVNK